jgi:rhodanese-related sulfurtransferase
VLGGAAYESVLAGQAAGAGPLGGVGAAGGTVGTAAKTDMRPLMIAGGVFAVIAFIVLIIAIMPHKAASNTVIPSNTIIAQANTTPVPNLPPANTAPAPNGDDTDTDTTPPVGNGQETQVVNNADSNAVNQYETEVIDGGPPATLAGATLINTQQLTAVMTARDQHQQTFWLIDARACSGETSIPTAVCFTTPDPNAQPDTAAEMSDILSGIPDKSTNLIIFCHDGGCPMSYNLATAAIQAGYQHVYWYRGGINAWQSAGLPTSNSAQTGP